MMSRHDPGFTLIEMAVAIFVIALLLGSFLVPLATQVEQRQISDTEKTLTEYRDALLGFAVANGYLPCPDTGTNGAENFNSGTGQCSTTSGGIAYGRLPHSTLGLTNSDVWGNRVSYYINEQYARRSPAASFSLTTVGNDINICTTQSCATVLSSTAVFALVSHGRNGYGAINSSTGAQNALSSSADEQENYDTDRNIVHRTRTPLGATAGEYDDIVVWLPRYFLFNRMVAAGKLP